MDTDDLIRLLDRWRSRKVLVVGDFMLDQYSYGNAERLSPDAPVPVLAVVRQEHKPGGSANVSLDLRALKCEVACVGVVGRDAAGKSLRKSLRDAGCDVSGLIEVSDRPTTVKHNLVGLAQHRHPQKMFRLDHEDKQPVDAATTRRLLAAVKAELPGTSVICLEDYNKGVLTEALCQGVVKLAKARRIPVLVDPAAISDYRKYTGVTSMTPNRFEVALACGERDVHDPPTWHRCATQLVRDLKMQSIVVTLDKHGALLLEKGRRPTLLPTQARAVYDPTGAGDMVLAMLAGALANDAHWLNAVQLANVAAGLEVEKFGVVPVELSEIHLAILLRRHEKLGKVRTLDQLLPEIAAHRSRGAKIAFTNGCFDILHAGHVSYLREARRKGDLLVVGLNSDASIRRIKGEGRPVNHQDDRLLVLSELQSVDYLILFDQDTPLDLIRAVQPDVLVKGADYKKSQVVGADIVERRGGEVALVPLVEGRSTTNIIGKIRGNEAPRLTPPTRATGSGVAGSPGRGG